MKINETSTLKLIKGAANVKYLQFRDINTGLISTKKSIFLPEFFEPVDSI